MITSDLHLLVGDWERGRQLLLLWVATTLLVGN